MKSVCCIALLLSLNFISCFNKKNTQRSEVFQQEESKDEKSGREKKVNYNVVPEIVEENFQPEKQHLNFQIRQAVLAENSLKISVKYGGGCRSHDFKLVLPAQLSSDTLQFYLLHLTQDDPCRAFVMNDLEFETEDILQYFQGKKVLKVNDVEVTGFRK